MEPITHFLTGACIGRAGLNRKTAYATLAAVLAAEAADIDILWSFAGPVEELKHHRGITHTFIAVPVVAAAAVGAVWLYDRWRRARQLRKLAVASTPQEQDALRVEVSHPSRKNKNAARVGHPTFLANSTENSSPRQEIRWGWIYLAALLSALSHLLLDWTNNYGLRPFFPFNAHWYAGSFVFIAEPALWALLIAALVMPWLFGLADSEIGARKKPFRGRGWAIFALAGMVVLWGWRWAEQGRARMLAENSGIATAPVKRMALEPYPINPFHWHAILETAEYYQTAEINTLSGGLASDPRRDLLYKPSATAATEAAKQTLLGQVYLDWGTWAVVRDVGAVAVPGMTPPQLPPNRAWTTVEFDDLRWGYSYLGAGRTSNRAPLSGWVYIVDGRDEAGEAMNGREQK
jgi:inner membrane protein